MSGQHPDYGHGPGWGQLTLIIRDVHLYDGGPNLALAGSHAGRIADAILAAGFHRSVASAPSDETIKSALYRGLGGLVGSYVPSHIADRAAAEIRTAVSAPPTVTDEMVLRADDAMLSFRSGTQEEMIRAMLRAALGGEA